LSAPMPTIPAITHAVSVAMRRSSETPEVFSP